jgi:hypothetical protein
MKYKPSIEFNYTETILIKVMLFNRKLHIYFAKQTKPYKWAPNFIIEHGNRYHSWYTFEFLSYRLTFYKNLWEIQETCNINDAVFFAKTLPLSQQQINRRITHLYGIEDKIYAPNGLGAYTPPPNELEIIYNTKVKTFKFNTSS